MDCDPRAAIRDSFTNGPSQIDWTGALSGAGHLVIGYSRRLVGNKERERESVEACVVVRRVSFFACRHETRGVRDRHK